MASLAPMCSAMLSFKYRGQTAKTVRAFVPSTCPKLPSGFANGKHSPARSDNIHRNPWTRTLVVLLKVCIVYFNVFQLLPLVR